MIWLLLLQVLGASWYLLSIERQAMCWKSECRNELGPVKCLPRYLDCGTLDDNDRIKWENSTLVFNNCNPENTTSFNYGIFEKALTNNIVSSKFLEKYLYCLWWGLQNLRYRLLMLFLNGWLSHNVVGSNRTLIYLFFFLNYSSYAQSLATSTYIGETLFAILISIIGLVLFAHLIGNMQVLRSL